MASNTANSECVYNAQTSNTNITDTCLQLALEGEKLCKAGNCGDGIAFFEAALQVTFFKKLLELSKNSS